MVRIREIDWETTHHSHVTKHGFGKEEIEEIIFYSDHDPVVEEGPGDLYYIYGQSSEDGSYMKAVVKPSEQQGEIILISIQEIRDAERKRYKELRAPKRSSASTQI